MCIDIYVNYLLFLSDFNETEFCQQIFLNTQISNLKKIRLVGSESFHVDRQLHRQRRTDKQTERQADVTKLIAAFRNFANVPKRFGSNLLCLARFSDW